MAKITGFTVEELQAELARRQAEAVLSTHTSALCERVRSLVEAYGQPVPTFKVEYRQGTDPLAELKAAISQEIAEYGEAQGIELPALDVTYTVKDGEPPVLGVKVVSPSSASKGESTTKPEPLHGGKVKWIGPDGFLSLPVKNGQVWDTPDAFGKAIRALSFGTRKIANPTASGFKRPSGNPVELSFHLIQVVLSKRAYFDPFVSIRKHLELVDPTPEALAYHQAAIAKEPKAYQPKS